MMRPIGLLIVPLLAVLLAAVVPAVAVASLGTQAAGVVTVSYNLHRLPPLPATSWRYGRGQRRKAGQNLVCHLFTGKGGYSAAGLSAAVAQAAGLDGPPPTPSMPSPGRPSALGAGARLGLHRQRRQPGAARYYIYKIEGNIFWAKGVLWQAK
jgi:hypothetical protein